jgi:ATP-dependent Lon protease
MEIIELPGYIDTEKVEIAKHYLLPKSLKKSGLKKSNVKYTKDSFLYIANAYCREAGVRNLEKNLDKIHRKIAKELVEEEEGSKKEKGKSKEEAMSVEEKSVADTAEEKGDSANNEPSTSTSLPSSAPHTIDHAAIEKYLGKPIFPEDVYKKADRPGMAVGLAWTSMGGDTLIIEAQSYEGKEEFKATGNLGDTMKESAAIAFSVARKLAEEKYGIKAKWFETHRIHLHIPEGATPKDGPSAGITMATALLSLFRRKTISKNVVMTGELSLTGQVLPIGGLKEKTIAARRNNAKKVIIPKQNMRDLDDIPEHVKNSLEFIPVQRFEDVLEVVLK